jgi:ABC-type sulfate/molybdate transport systems ATPase subunit
MNPMQQQVRIEGLVRKHRATRGDAGFQLGPIDLELAAGGRTAVVGPSGCGKTTLLRCIAGLETPAAGRVLVGGDDVRTRKAPGDTGFVFQSGALWPHMTVRQHVAFAAPHRDAAAVEELLSRVGLGHALGRRPAQLSGGEAQRLGLARALAGQPSLLLLDEPLHSVDVHLRRDLIGLIGELAAERGLTVIAVTHDRDEALALADHLVLMRQGAIVEAGPAAQLVRAPRTAFTASFLADATCLPTRDDGSSLTSAFGTLARPAGPTPLSLVLLPGDLELDPSGVAGRPHCAGRVVSARPRGEVWEVLVRLADGHTVAIAAGTAQVPGREVVVRLRGEPRLLPELKVNGRAG